MDNLLKLGQYVFTVERIIGEKNVLKNKKSNRQLHFEVERKIIIVILVLPALHVSQIAYIPTYIEAL